jgi:hypothetical protein
MVEFQRSSDGNPSTGYTATSLSESFGRTISTPKHISIQCTLLVGLQPSLLSSKVSYSVRDHLPGRFYGPYAIVGLWA